MQLAVEIVVYSSLLAAVVTWHSVTVSVRCFGICWQIHCLWALHRTCSRF